MRQLERYLQINVIKSIFMILLIMVVLLYLIGVVNELPSVGKNNYTAMTSLLVVLMQLPAQIYQVTPIIGFLGCLLGLGALSSRSELTIMRASGVSINQIAWCVAKLAIIFILVVTFMGEVAAPILQNEAAHIKSVALQQISKKLNLSNIWLYSNNRYVNIGELVSSRVISDVSIYKFDRNQHLLTVLMADKGVSLGNNRWQLTGVHLLTKKGTKRFVNEKLDMDMVNINVNPKVLHFEHQAIQWHSVIVLIKDIMYLKQSGLSTSSYVYSLWRRLLQPLISILMICLAVPFVFGSLRDSSMTVRFIIGLSIGFVFYMTNQLFGPIAMIYSFPAVWAAALPLLMIMVGYCFLLYRVD